MATDTHGLLRRFMKLVSWRMTPWLLLLLLLKNLAHSAPVLKNGTELSHKPVQSADEPLVISYPNLPLHEILPSQFVSSITAEPLLLTENVTISLPMNSIFKRGDIHISKDTKWWCGNNTFSRGMAHFIAKFDENIDQINDCCRIHDHEYDIARTFREVSLSDAKFDQCLSNEGNLYRKYIVRPLFNTAVNMNYFYERLKSTFKSLFLGGDGFIDLR